MRKHRRNDLLIPFLLVATDAAAILAGFVVSYYIRFHDPVAAWSPVTKGFPSFSAYVIGALVIIPAWLLLFNGKKLYGARRQVDMPTELFTIIRVVTFGMLIVLSATFFYREFSYSRLVFVMIWFWCILFIFAGRWLIMRYEVHLYRHGRERRNVLLIGADATAQHVAQRIHHDPALGYHLVGFCSEEEELIESAPARRLGPIEEIARVVEEHNVETIVVCLPQGSEEILRRIIGDLEGRNVQVLLQPEVIGVVPTRLRLKEILGIPFLGIKDIPMTTWNRIAKRSFDILFSLAVLFLSLPFAILAALLVRIDSGRPVFYRQTRVGLEGEEFTLYIFRSMAADAERETGPTWTKKEDPRVTRAGRILRRTSLDELPQFFNVLRGDMSVVGPRPERPEFVDHFKNYVPKYVERHRLKTGITGWAQVNGLRGEAPIAERTRYDLYYIENWSLGLDIRIIFKTVRAVIFGKDAY